MSLGEGATPQGVEVEQSEHYQIVEQSEEIIVLESLANGRRWGITVDLGTNPEQFPVTELEPRSAEE